MRIEGKICPFCHTALSASDTAYVCSACGTPHHVDCWQENGNCTTYGCQGKPLDSRLAPEPDLKIQTDDFIYCPTCGSKLSRYSRFCYACGANMSSDNTASKPPVQSVPHDRPIQFERPIYPAETLSTNEGIQIDISSPSALPSNPSEPQFQQAELDGYLFDQVRVDKKLSGKSMRWYLFYINVLSIMWMIFSPLSYMSQFENGTKWNATGMTIKNIYLFNLIVGEILIFMSRGRLKNFLHSGYVAVMLLFTMNIVSNIIVYAVSSPYVDSASLAGQLTTPVVFAALNMLYFYKRRHLFNRI